jgi:hypothetical protein
LSVKTGVVVVSATDISVLAEVTLITVPPAIFEAGAFLVVPSALSTKTRKSSRLMLQVGSQDILVGDIILKLYN